MMKVRTFIPSSPHYGSDRTGSHEWTGIDEYETWNIIPSQIAGYSDTKVFKCGHSINGMFIKIDEQIEYINVTLVGGQKLHVIETKESFEKLVGS